MIVSANKLSRLRGTLIFHLGEAVAEPRAGPGFVSSKIKINRTVLIY